MRRDELEELIIEFAEARATDAGPEPNATALLAGPLVDAAPEILRVVLQATEGLCDDPVCTNCPPLRAAIEAFWERAAGTAWLPNVAVAIPTFQHQPSSNVAAVGYDRDSRTLQVDFTSGGIYRYGNVTPAQAAPLLSSDRSVASVGVYVGREFVRRPDVHPFVKMVESIE